MSIRRWLRRAANIMAVALVAWIALVTLMSPWHTRWGSTDAELRAALPGDEPMTGSATYWLQHAVTIHAPVSAVWPWLAQLGTDRAGFYSYERLEQLFGIPVHSADAIHPEWQEIETGGFVTATPQGYLGIGHPLGWKLTLVERERVMVLENWGAFVLLASDSATTRFIVRTRNDQPATFSGIAAAWVGLVLFEPAHFIMQRGMMLGVKARAERVYHSASTRE